MKCRILHETKGRMRIHIESRRVTARDADVLEYTLNAQDGIRSVDVSVRTGNAVICYACKREELLRRLAKLSFTDEAVLSELPTHSPRTMNAAYTENLFFTVAERIANRLLYPLPLQIGLTLFRSVKYIAKGIRSLFSGQIQVALLDATAITVSLLRRDFDTASSVMFLLKIGEILEEWTHKKSVEDLARTMSLNIDKVWTVSDGQEVLLPIGQVHIGDHIIVRTGSMIPLDGRVVSGDAEVNQASMTGESMPVHKERGSFAYAGTVVEEGECTIEVTVDSGTGKYDRIVQMIEDSQKLKSDAEGRAANLADRLVPFSLGGTALTYLLTRDVTKALSILMVDFSCALKLAMPISVLSAMRECGRYGITVKGGRFLESAANADTIVFDKTGTLTHAVPKVAEVIAFAGEEPEEMLRMAACLEEHYPHSMANAVVRAAESRGLIHEERHSKVEYVVAHGIASIVDGERVVIGSYHFVFDDEKCRILPEDEERFMDLPPEYSHLFLGIGGVLSAVICIYDPIRNEAAEVVDELHRRGLERIVMMTGDNRRTAEAIAKQVGVDRYFAEVLPEDKARFVKEEQENGHIVLMVGDGVNDSPALSEADAGIAISDGAAIAREVADITVAADDLYSLLVLRDISGALMERIRFNYRTIISFNLSLILLGVAGVLAPTTTAVLHNASTILLGVHSLTDLKE